MLLSNALSVLYVSGMKSIHPYPDWHARVFMVTTLSWLVAPDVVITTHGATSHHKVGFMKTLSFQFLNSSPPSAAYMRQWIGPALAQIMACGLNQCRVIVSWTLRNKFMWNFNRKTKPFIHENASENIVCEKAAILSRVWWLNCPHYSAVSWIIQTVPKQRNFNLISRSSPRPRTSCHRLCVQNHGHWSSPSGNGTAAVCSRYPRDHHSELQGKKWVSGKDVKGPLLSTCGMYRKLSNIRRT